MRILLSPAKKMCRDQDFLAPEGLPQYLPKARQILAYLNSLDGPALQKLWGCSNAIAQENMTRLKTMDLQKDLTPAILSYDGIAYQHMAPSVFTDQALAYVQDHLRILSGLYGVLRPLDGVTPYRLELQAKAKVGSCRDLYEFWGRDLYEGSRDESGVFINLASKEYSKAVVPYLQPQDHFIHVTFCEMVKGKLTQKATFAKMARGEMVRFLAENQVEDPRAMADFNSLNYQFRPELSSEKEYVFERCP